MKARTWIIAVLLATVIGAAACSTTREVPLPNAEDRPATPSPTKSPTIFDPAPGENGSPPSPFAPPTDLVEFDGTGSTKITRENGEILDLTFDSMNAYSYYGGPKGLTGLVFNNLDGTALSVGGILRKGPQKTSTNVGLSLFIVGKDGEDDMNFVSGSGSCVINLIEATERDFSGTFRCPKAPLTEDETVTVAGAFSGSLG